MTRLMGETEPLSVGRHVAVEENARRHVRNLDCEAIHLERGKIAMDNDAACSLYPRDQLSDRPGRHEPSPTNEFGDPLGISAKLVPIKAGQRKFRLQLGGV